MIQELWKKGIEWDEPIDVSLEGQVAQWLEDVHELESLLFPRYVGSTSSPVPVTVHMSADASEKAHGCSICVVTDYDTFLIYAKAKVAQLKSESPARLELQAAFLGSRALQLVLSESRLARYLGRSRMDRLDDSSALDQPAVIPGRRLWRTGLARSNRSARMSQWFGIIVRDRTIQLSQWFGIIAWDRTIQQSQWFGVIVRERTIQRCC